MTETFLNHALFGWFPYFALTVFLVGSLLRFDREQYTWKTGSSQMLRSRQLRIGSNLFHVGILVLFFGHLFGMLTPYAVFSALGIGAGAKQVMAIVVGGVAGIATIAGSSIRASAPRRASPTPRSCSSSMRS
jgi:nitrate reductase gamma subunit